MRHVLKYVMSALNMNPFVYLSLLYGFITMGSASILYYSFRGKVDQSGNYFLLSELLFILLVMHVIAINVFPELESFLPLLYLGNFLHSIAEFAVFLSICSLQKKIEVRLFWGFLIFSAAYCFIIEMFRHSDPKLPVLIISCLTGIIAFATYLACKAQSDESLKNNIFLKWLRFIELGLVIFSVMRIASYFSPTPIVPRHPSTPTIIIYTIFIALSVFRYISYQSLRISWLNRDATNANPLNRNLAKVMQERNHFLEALTTSNRAIGISALANSLAHQLSQPITSIIFNTQSVRRELIKFKEHENLIKSLDLTSKQLNDLSGLIHNLRLLFGAKEPKLEQVTLEDICRPIIDLLETILQDKEISLIKRYEANPYVLVNSIHVQQVLINIFNNSIEAIVNRGSDEKVIILTLSQYQQNAVISVEDSGSGIPPEIQANLFELYKTSKKDGLGIGLWLSNEIIKRHNGSIIASNRANGGAILEINLPIQEAKS